ncbi:aldehyde dehydrogenase family protein [Croceicoccus sediminis]|uniref:aldehyde dehydrogenase family protein n=1 Tax=Croceicoccus sediminis TaxID=2571150 RepID=UPI001183D02C|nr:aldehyde dehydrogenase family protein [Croceicoccus sediminis]
MTLANDYGVLNEGARALLYRRTGMFLDGAFRDAASGKTMDVVDPTTGGVVANVPDAGAGDVELAVRSAHRAFRDTAWSGLRPHEREAVIMKLAALVEAEADALAQVETVNSGKLIGNTRAFDADFSVHVLRQAAGWATRLSGRMMELAVPYMPNARFTGSTHPRPVGVIGAIVPWNVPLCMAVFKLAPALATGCTIVIKPAERTPLTALRLAELCIEAGIPAGVVNVVTGGATAGQALVEHPLVDKISFTGSTAVGRRIGASAGERLIPFCLELGGKSPVVIAPDADLEMAISGAAWAILGNHGQNCCAGSRLFVHENHFDQVVEGIAQIAASLVIGPGLDPASTMGPMISHEHRDRVVSYVEQARKDGASLITGGDPLSDDGAYMHPAVIVGAGDGSPVAQEEIFGPVLTAFRFDDLDDVMPRVNNSQYGLGASIWTRDMATADRFADKVEAGTVWINNHNTLDCAMPFGGWKQSGFGQELGEEGIRAHLKTQARIVRH